MRNRLFLTLVMIAAAAALVFGERFRIQRLNTPAIVIDNREYHQGDTINSPQNIDWTDDSQAVQLVELTTGNLYFFSAKEHKGAGNLWKRLYAEEKGSMREIRTRSAAPDVRWGDIDVRLVSARLRGDSLVVSLWLTSEADLTLTRADSADTQQCALDSEGGTYTLGGVSIQSPRLEGSALHLPGSVPVHCSVIVVQFNPRAGAMVQMKVPFKNGDGERMPLVLRNVPANYTAPEPAPYVTSGKAVR